MKVARSLADLLLLAYPARTGDGSVRFCFWLDLLHPTHQFVWSCTNTALCLPPLGGLVMASGVPSIEARLLQSLGVE